MHGSEHRLYRFGYVACCLSSNKDLSIQILSYNVKYIIVVVLSLLCILVLQVGVHAEMHKHTCNYYNYCYDKLIYTGMHTQVHTHTHTNTYVYTHKYAGLKSELDREKEDPNTNISDHKVKNAQVRVHTCFIQTTSLLVTLATICVQVTMLSSRLTEIMGEYNQAQENYRVKKEEMIQRQLKYG